MMAGVTVSKPQIELIEGCNFLEGDISSMLLGIDVLSRLHLYIAYHVKKFYISDANAH